MPDTPEPLALFELQIAKNVLETKARRLRTELRELRRTRPSGWAEEFERVQAELIEVVTGIGQLEQRICAAVEGEAGEAGHDA